MKYIHLANDNKLKTHLNNAKDLWNNEQHKYEIDDFLWNQNIVKNEDFTPGNSVVVYDNDTLVGFCFIKLWNQTYHITPYMNRAWISLIYVAKDHRRKHVASKMLHHVESKLQALSINEIVLGKDTYNFFAGLNDEFHDSSKFFEAMNFYEEETSYDFLRSLKNADKIPISISSKYNMKVASKEDFKAMHQFFETEFKGRWDFEFKQYVNHGGTGREFVIILHDDEVVAFCRNNDLLSVERLYNTNWIHNYPKLVGIGPLGVSSKHRKQGLGFAVTAYAINHAIDKEASHSIIDWTSLVDFYRKFGYSICTTILAYTKQLS